VIPYVEKGDSISGVELYLRMAIPMFIFNNILFFTLFENILPVFAEITSFGDR